MKRCESCGTENLDSSQFCDECGARLVRAENGAASTPAFQSNSLSNSGSRSASVTSIGIPPLVETKQPESGVRPDNDDGKLRNAHARLTIERGDSANTVFSLSAEESYIGRWDADNGIFPDVDLDAFDPDAKVSRRHARVIFRNNIYMIEDLGSTNGTFVNRGRRLLPGSPQVLTEADEIIVGKTFLRFHING
ncbi:MAG TPA: FHA domain-containing protein [Pyrinomonadaceae bacterium]|nr:FHA domain-containing protein [Pyrinomonadaceae bacterium]